MPLRANLNGKEYLASIMTDEEWINLKKYSKSINLDPTISQTGGKAYLRTSKLGIRHFCHKKGEKPDGWKPESPEHEFIKNQIAIACNNMGWSAITEYKENDWEADVLAIKGDIRVAFEVQWSYQTKEITWERQNKYIRDNVRCAWFFRRIPKDLHDIHGQAVEIAELPIFKFEKHEDNFLINFPAERIYERQSKLFSIDDFISILLGGGLRFKGGIEFSNLKFDLYTHKCHKCKATNYIHLPFYNGINSQIECQCNRKAFLNTHPYNLEYSSLKQVVDFMHLYGISKGIRIAAIKKSNNSVDFGCYNCDSIFNWWRLNRRNNYVRTLDIKVEHSIESPHWCLNLEQLEQIKNELQFLN